MVITGLTRNQVVLTGSWVRIPPLPPNLRCASRAPQVFFCLKLEAYTESCHFPNCIESDNSCRTKIDYSLFYFGYLPPLLRQVENLLERFNKILDFIRYCEYHVL